MVRKIFKNELFIIILTVFLDALGFAILIPIVPQLFANPSSHFYLLSKEASLETGYILLGAILAIFPLMQFFSTTILGQLSDKVGRKRVLLVTIFGTAFSYGLFAIGVMFRMIPVLFIARALAGITTGNISVAQAAVADITEPKDRAKNFGLIGAAFGIGFILGPFLGASLSDPKLISFFNPSTPFWFAAILSIINVISVKFNFSETIGRSVDSAKINLTKSVTNILKIFELKNLRLLYLTNFLFFLGLTFYITFITVFMIEKFKFSEKEIGYFFSYVGVWFALTQIFIIRVISKYFSERQIVRVSLISGGVAIILILLTKVWWQLVLIAPILAMSNALSIANIAGLISRTSDQSIQGEILGINVSVQALGSLIPPILSGIIAAAFSPAAPILTAALMLIFAGVLFISFYHPKKGLD